jgi:hypothetical protein
MTMSKISVLLQELTEELASCEAALKEDHDEYVANGGQSDEFYYAGGREIDSGNFDDTFSYGEDWGRQRQTIDSLKKIITRIKGMSV